MASGGGRRKKALIGLGAVLLLIAASCGALIANLPGDQGPRVDARPGLVGVNGGSYIWILKSTTGVVLVDTGQDTSGKAILDELARMGLGPADVRGVLLTHAHIDHVGALPLFPNAPLWLGEKELAFFNGDPQGAWSLGAIVVRLFGAPPRPQEPTLVSDGTTFEVDGLAFQAVLLPGHTPGSTAWLHGDLLLGGDAALVADGVVRIAPAVFNHDSAEATRTLQRLKTLPFTDLADGHAGFTARAKDLL